VDAEVVNCCTETTSSDLSGPPDEVSPRMPATEPNIDPRRLITQEAFSVSPQLLGLPLARPSRRLTALLLDLLFVAILVNVGGAALFGIAAAFAFFRFASRAIGKGGSFFGKSARLALRGVATMILFGVAVSTWDWAGEALGGGDGEKTVAAVADVKQAGAANPAKAAAIDPAAVASVASALRRVPGFEVLEVTADSAAAGEAAARVVGEMRRAGVPDADIRQALLAAAGESENAWMPAVVENAFSPAAEAKALPPESLAVRYAAAAGRDPAEAQRLGARLGSVLARDSLRALRSTVGELRGEVDELEKREKEREESGLLATLLRLLDDLGLSFGWNALYFTAFTALWKGQTPGKRLLGIRVVRLNGQPMTLWSAFERFGGYAAGVLTGLLGFAQVYWDRNRQAIHDKITETVVIRDRGGDAAPVASPALTANPAPGLRSAPR
jgi:hypothetical protein